ncbi:MAG: DsrE family protein [Desulfomonilaceae bacterium]
MKKSLGISFLIVICCGLVWPAFAEQSGPEKSTIKGELRQQMDTKAHNKLKVVFHLDSDQEARLVLALANIKNLFKEVPPQQCRVNIVANGKAVTLFRKDKVGERASEIKELHKLGVSFKMCRNALAKSKIDKADLSEVCEIVPAGILELINLQQQGFAYIKP